MFEDSQKKWNMNTIPLATKFLIMGKMAINFTWLLKVVYKFCFLKISENRLFRPKRLFVTYKNVRRRMPTTGSGRSKLEFQSMGPAQKIKVHQNQTLMEILLMHMPLIMNRNSKMKKNHSIKISQELWSNLAKFRAKKCVSFLNRKFMKKKIKCKKLQRDGLVKFLASWLLSVKNREPQRSNV